MGGNEITFLLRSLVYLIVRLGVNDVGLVANGTLRTLSVPAFTMAVVPFKLALSTDPA